MVTGHDGYIGTVLVPLFQRAGHSVLGVDSGMFHDCTFVPQDVVADDELWLAERDLTVLADDDFSPTFLRNATAFGVSPRLRGDLVVNNLVGYAFATQQVLLKSDGMPWRPLVHIEDIARAFLAVIEAPRETVHLKAYNVGTDENYRIREVAEIVADVVPDSKVTFSPTASPDTRNYRVDCSFIRRELPAFQPQWTVRRGVEELFAAYEQIGLTAEELESSRYQRIKHVRELQDAGRLDADLRHTGSAEVLGV
jgi:nucleoside-diphosphate-sugar epimerase